MTWRIAAGMLVGLLLLGLIGYVLASFFGSLLNLGDA